jgi:hypothetical protein
MGYILLKQIKLPLVILSFLLVLAANRECLGQSNPDSTAKGISLVVGIGPDYAHKQTFFAELAMARYEFGNWYIGARYLYGNQSVLGVDPDETINDFGILAGYYIRKKYYYLSAGAGLSFTNFVNRGKFIDSAYSVLVGDIAPIYESLHSHSLCVPLQIEVFWTPSDIIGIGVILFDNINSTENNYGFFISLKATLY